MCVCVCRYDGRELQAQVQVKTAWLDAKLAQEFNLPTPHHRLSHHRQASHSQAHTDTGLSTTKHSSQYLSSEPRQMFDSEGVPCATPDVSSRSNNSKLHRVQHDLVLSTQEVEEMEGCDWSSERPDSQISSYSHGSSTGQREGLPLTRGFTSELGTPHYEASSSFTSVVLVSHPQRRVSDDRVFRSTGERDSTNRKRRASSPAQTHTHFTKRTRADRLSTEDDQRGNIFSRLGPSSQQRDRDRRTSTVGDSMSPQSYRIRSHSSQNSSESRSQSPSSSPPGRSSRRDSCYQGNGKKRRGSSPSSKGQSTVWPRRREEREQVRERNTEQSKTSVQMRERREREKEKERETSRRRRDKQNSESDRDPEKSSHWRVKNEPSSSSEEKPGIDCTQHKFEDKRQTRMMSETEMVCNIIWGESEAGEAEPASLKEDGRVESSQAAHLQGRAAAALAEVTDTDQLPSEGLRDGAREPRETERVQVTSVDDLPSEEVGIREKSKSLFDRTINSGMVLEMNKAEQPQEKATPPTSPPTSRDYAERDVTPPLEVLQGMQTSYQPPFFCPVSLTAFHPHLFAGHDPLALPTASLSFSVAPAPGGVVSDVISSSGVWPVPGGIPSGHWPQLWVGGSQQSPTTSSSASTTTEVVSSGDRVIETLDRTGVTVEQTSSHKDDEVDTKFVKGLNATQSELESSAVESAVTQSLPSSPGVPEGDLAMSASSQTTNSAPQTSDIDRETVSQATESQGKESVPLALEGSKSGGDRVGMESGRKAEATCKLQQKQMMEVFRRHAKLLALSTKMMIRYKMC